MLESRLRRSGERCSKILSLNGYGVFSFLGTSPDFSFRTNLGLWLWTNPISWNLSEWGLPSTFGTSPILLALDWSFGFETSPGFGFRRIFGFWDVSKSFGFELILGFGTSPDFGFWDLSEWGFPLILGSEDISELWLGTNPRGLGFGLILWL